MAKDASDTSHDVNASPAKAFFVEMITRDIELQDAILDLLDNCVDGVRRSAKIVGDLPYEGYYAKITMSEDKFIIEDNCGGIPLDVAKKYAFMMGRPAQARDTKAGTIGVYGIGMKRAIFKMGRSCVVHSHTKQHTFEVAITEKWMDTDDEWNLKYRDVDSVLEDYGTRISIKNLNPVVKSEFAEGSDFRDTFIGVVRDTYGFLLTKGFKITINGEVAEPKFPTLLWDNSNRKEVLRPYIYKAEIDKVKIFLAVGFRERPETSPNDESNTEAQYRSEDAGWTIICNDRAVLSNDKTKQTGWGWGGVPSYHTQFIAVSGYVIFEGNPADLPLTTTKRGVDANSTIYTTVRDEMQAGMQRFTKFTNDWKGHDAKPVFQNAISRPLTEIKHEVEAGVVKLTVLRSNEKEEQTSTTLPVRPKETTHRRITFVKADKDIRKVASYLFETPDKKPSDVGAECFDYVLARAK